MGYRNKHGLPREIPPVVRRIVRQRCGFGCVCCGSAIIEYHHFNPEFHEARDHHAAGITLLCPGCHAQVHKGLLAHQLVVTADAAPKCLQAHYTKHLLHLASGAVPFRFGSARFMRPLVVIYDDLPLVAFNPAEFPGGPVRLNAQFYDPDSKSLLSIVNNEWRAQISRFDIETTSNALVIRAKQGSILLRLISHGGVELEIDRLRMAFNGYFVEATCGDFVIKNPFGGVMHLECHNIYSTLRLSSDGSTRL